MCRCAGINVFHGALHDLDSPFPRCVLLSHIESSFQIRLYDFGCPGQIPASSGNRRAKSKDSTGQQTISVIEANNRPISNLF